MTKTENIYIYMLIIHLGKALKFEWTLVLVLSSFLAIKLIKYNNEKDMIIGGWGYRVIVAHN